MGADVFRVVAKGATVQEAFDSAVAQARHDHGHSGYTGTIAEKGHDGAGWVVRFPPASLGKAGKCPTCGHETKALNVKAWADDLIDKGSDFDDKWGPCAAVQLEPGVWYFLGWASS